MKWPYQALTVVIVDWNRWKVQCDQVLIGLVTKFLLVKDTLARNSKKHSPKNNSCTVIAKLNFTHYIHINQTSKPAKFQRNRM